MRYRLQVHKTRFAISTFTTEESLCRNKVTSVLASLQAIPCHHSPETLKGKPNLVVLNPGTPIKSHQESTPPRNPLGTPISHVCLKLFVSFKRRQILVGTPISLRAPKPN